MHKTFMLLVLTAISCAACLRQGVFLEFDNYVETDALRAEYGKPTMHLTVGKKLLWLAGLVGHEDRTFSDIVTHVNTARIVSYRLNRNPAPALKAVRDAARKLVARGWQPIIEVSEADEQTRILVKLGDDSIDGMVVMSVHPGDEAVFIGILGELTPDLMSRLTRDLDIDEKI